MANLGFIGLGEAAAQEQNLPIAGLYRTGATTHPGASVSAGPGRNAAMVILHDLGIEFPSSEGR